MSENIEDLVRKTKTESANEESGNGYINWSRVRLSGLKVPGSMYRPGVLLPLDKERFYL